MSGDLLSRLRDFVARKRDWLRGKGVVALILFGSRARGTAWGLSDVDVAVLFDRDDRDEGELADELQRAVRADLDLVVLNRAPPGLRFSALGGAVLFVSDEGSFVRFAARALDEWFDLEPLRRTAWRYTARWLGEGGRGGP